VATDEKHILSRIAEGESKAFQYLYTNYYKVLCVYVFNYLNNSSETENIVQNIFLSLWENRENAVTIKNVKSYLFQSAKFQCINYIKKESVRQKFDDEASYLLKKMELEIDDLLISSEQQEEIEKAIDSLPEQRQKVFMMKRLEGMSYKEISQKLGISERTVETHVANAVKLLKTKLAHLVKFSTFFILIRILLTGF